MAEACQGPECAQGVLQPFPCPIPVAWLPVLKESYSMVQGCLAGSGCWGRASVGASTPHLGSCIQAEALARGCYLRGVCVLGMFVPRSQSPLPKTADN